MAAPSILIVTTSHAAIGDTGEPTGVWLEELTTPYYAFRDAGATVTIASIAGGAVPIDPRSTVGDLPSSVKRFQDDHEAKKAIATTPAIDTIDIDAVNAIFLPGGHGTMWDLPTSAALSQRIADSFAVGKVVAAVCHGPAGLVSVKDSTGKSIVADRRVTGFTDSEERAVGLQNTVPFLLESRLRELGGRFENAPDFQPFAVADGQLVTGQNPASSALVAKLTLESIKA